MDKIYTRTYHDFKIDKSYFKADLIFTIRNEMIMTCSKLFGRQYKQLRTLLIPLCLKSHDKYSFNLLMIIALFYHLYTEYEIYTLEYNKRKGILNGSLQI